MERLRFPGGWEGAAPSVPSVQEEDRGRAEGQAGRAGEGVWGSAHPRELRSEAPGHWTSRGDCSVLAPHAVFSRHGQGLRL